MILRWSTFRQGWSVGRFCAEKDKSDGLGNLEFQI